jgi:hypothetical protein
LATTPKKMHGKIKPNTALAKTSNSLAYTLLTNSTKTTNAQKLIA